VSETKSPTPSLLLTVEDAAELSGFKYSSLLQWMHEGIVPFVQVPGKKRMYIRRDVLLDLIKQWQQQLA